MSGEEAGGRSLGLKFGNSLQNYEQTPEGISLFLLRGTASGSGEVWAGKDRAGNKNHPKIAGERLQDRTLQVFWGESQSPIPGILV